MKANDYRDLVAQYVAKNFADRVLKVYTEVSIGKSYIGKGRRVDVLVVCPEQESALAIECKHQDVKGTTDEKIPYALQDLRLMRMAGVLCYSGGGWSTGVLHMLESSELGAYCLPTRPALARTKATKELDDILCMHFGWWDLIVEGKTPIQLPPDEPISKRKRRRRAAKKK